MQPNATRCKRKLSQGRQTAPSVLAQVPRWEVSSRTELPVLDRSRLLSSDCVCRCRKARLTLDLFCDVHVCNEHLRANTNEGTGLRPAGASLGEPPANPQSARSHPCRSPFLPPPLSLALQKLRGNDGETPGRAHASFTK